MGLNFGMQGKLFENNEYRMVVIPTDLTWTVPPTPNPNAITPNGAIGYGSLKIPQGATISKIYIDAEGDWGSKIYIYRVTDAGVSQTMAQDLSITAPETITSISYRLIDNYKYKYYLKYESEVGVWEFRKIIIYYDWDEIEEKA